MRVDKCRSCGAAILWATSGKTGKPMPLDRESERRIVITAGVAWVQETYVSHFVTCPNAKDWRK